jgi:predicted TIM-barrel fold metal-dependent hydrolase
MDKKLTFVSLDAHAQMPTEAWPKFLDKRYHDRLPDLNIENRLYTSLTKRFTARSNGSDSTEVFDTEGVLRDGGAEGLWNCDVRIAQMDREGVAAEFIHNGDSRVCGLFFQSSNTEYSMELCQAGVKAYNRWLYDTFGSQLDRCYLIGMLGGAPWRDMDELLEELDWIADHGFKATTAPGYVAYPGQPPLFDEYWDPFWARCEERGIILWMHAGQGERQAELGTTFHRIRQQIEKEKGSIEEAVERLSAEFFQGKVFSSVKPRRAMWQIMIGGVFDRHPKLRLVLSEIFGDWMGPTFKYLDAQYEAHRGDLRATRKPSDYYRSNCINGLSFIRRCEVALRHDLGVDRLAFGRDYPHAEGTWPNTIPWLRDALGGIPQDEVRAILGGNAIRILGLDEKKLNAIAERIGIPESAIFGDGPEIAPELVAHFHRRGQYLGEPEEETRIPEIQNFVREDLWRARAIA